MQAEASAPSATQTQSASRPRQRRPRGSKRGRGGANASESLSFRPASVAPPASQPPSANQAAPEASSPDNASRSRPSCRGRGRGGRAPQPDRRTADGRRFGGQLTQPDPATTQAQLQAEAAEFVPGQQNGSKPKTKPPRSNRDNRRGACLNHRHPISPPGLTRTSTTDTTNAPSAQARCKGTRRCGLATRAGLHST